MRVDGDIHAEHVKVLDALSSNLKAEVARGLRLLDSCVTQIAQAKWILTNVDESLSGFSKGCPVCGILPEKEKQLIKVSGGKEIKDKRVPPRSTSPKRSREVTPPPKPKSATTPVLRKKSPSPPPKPKPSQPVHRIGPRSKTRPNEPVAKSAGPATGSVDIPKSDLKSIAPVRDNKLPPKCSIVVSQTQPDVKLTDISPYLLGRVTRVDLTNLGGFVSPTHAIPNELKFKPKLIQVKSHKPVKKVVPGPASRRFLDDLKKGNPKALTPATVDVSDSSSSSEDNKPLKPAAPPPRPPPKTKDSDSGSDYDYNFAAAAKTTSSSAVKKSKIGSQVTQGKRSRPLSTDSDEDYSHRKKKGKKSIFKKTVSTSSNSDSDSDEYGRRRKKKIKRKDSTDKEKDKHSGSKTHGSKSSSVVSSRMSITFNSGGRSKGTERSSSNKERERHDSSASRGGGGGGSTTGSLVKSESGGKDVTTSTKPTPQAPTAPSVKPGYRPGPASRKIKPVDTPSSGDAKTKTSETALPGGGEKETENNVEKSAKSETTTNGTKESSAPSGKPDLFASLQQRFSKEAMGIGSQQQDPPPKKMDPLAMLRAKVKENTEAPPKDKPVVSTTIGAIDPQMKAKLAARLAVLAAKNKIPTKPVGVNKVPGPLKLSTPAASVTGVEPIVTDKSSPAVVADGVEDEKEIELGDDIIGKCIGDLGSDGEVAVHSPAATASIVLENDQVAFTLSPMPPPTLQDCVSPTAMNKFFTPPPEPDSPSTINVEKILKLLLKLAEDPSSDEAQLHSRDKLNELFASRLSSNSEEMETYRGDLVEGSWYMVKGKTLGRAVCADTISVFAFEKVATEELDRILAELESYTASSCR